MRKGLTEQKTIWPESAARKSLADLRRSVRDLLSLWDRYCGGEREVDLPDLGMKLEELRVKIETPPLAATRRGR